MHRTDGENAGQRAEVDELLDPDVRPQTPPLVGMSVVDADRSAVPIVGGWSGAATVAWVGYADPLARGLPSGEYRRSLPFGHQGAGAAGSLAIRSPSRPTKAKTESRQRKPFAAEHAGSPENPDQLGSAACRAAANVRGRR